MCETLLPDTRDALLRLVLAGGPLPPRRRLLQTHADPALALRAGPSSWRASGCTAEQCARLAHKLRGAAFNLGLERLGNCAASLEQEIGQIEAEGKLAERVQDLVGIHERTMQALAQTLDEAPGCPDPDGT